MNALFLKDLAQKTRRGLRGRVEQGLSGGGNSFGYGVVRRLLADGTVATGERVVEPAEADIVQRIFAEYIAGCSARKIAAGLNQDHLRSPRGGQWNASTIHGSRQRRNGILNNEMYVGRLVWNRQRFVKNPDTVILGIGFATLIAFTTDQPCIVVLPQPDPPKRQMNSPSVTEMEMSLSASNVPKDFRKLEIVNAAMGGAPDQGRGGMRTPHRRGLIVRSFPDTSSLTSHPHVDGFLFGRGSVQCHFQQLRIPRP